MTRQPRQVSQLLRDWCDGNQQAADQVVDVVYDELRRIARGMMRGERRDHTLQPTALIHEAYLRVCRDEPVDVQTRAAFLRLMAAQMKRHLIDHARRRGADKRGGGVPHEDIDRVEPPAAEPNADADDFLAQLDTALARLAGDYPRVATIIQLRFVADLSIEDTARALGLGTGTVKRDFAFGRAWLVRELSAAAPGHRP
jgi:RNA polymerase sigma factor (TIGR02999 family)